MVCPIEQFVPSAGLDLEDQDKDTVTAESHVTYVPSSYADDRDVLHHFRSWLISDKRISDKPRHARIFDDMPNLTALSVAFLPFHAYGVW